MSLTDRETTAFSTIRRIADAYRNRPPIWTKYANGRPSWPGSKRAWLSSL